MPANAKFDAASIAAFAGMSWSARFSAQTRKRGGRF